MQVTHKSHSCELSRDPPRRCSKLNSWRAPASRIVSLRLHLRVYLATFMVQGPQHYHYSHSLSLSLLFLLLLFIGKNIIATWWRNVEQMEESLSTVEHMAVLSYVQYLFTLPSSLVFF